MVQFRNPLFLLFLLFFAFGIFLFSVKQVNAQSCVGYFTCRACQQGCGVDSPDGPICDPIFGPQPCVCGDIQSTCVNGDIACSGLPLSQTCNTNCPPDTTSVGNTCYIEQPGPTPICSGGPVSYCSFGGGWYCCGSNMQCVGDASNYSCASCPGYGTNYKTVCQGNELHETYNNGTCGEINNFLQTCALGCVTYSSTSAGCATPTPTPPPGATATPTFTPTPTTPPGATAAPTPTPTTPPAATPTPAPFCGDGVCNGTETTATCPADCPAVAYTISGRVFIDNNGNGVYDAGSSTVYCKNGTCLASRPYLPTWIYITGRSSAYYCYDANANGDCGSSETRDSSPPLSPATWLWLTNFSPDIFCNDANGSGTCGVGEPIQLTRPRDTTWIATTVPADTPYAGASVRRSANITRTTDTNGQYSFTNLGASTYNITLTVPAGYAMSPVSPTNPKSVTVGPNGTANFAIVLTPPTCTGLASAPTTVSTGQTSTLTVSGCTGTPTYNWPAPTCGTDVNVNLNTTTYTAPVTACATSCTASVQATNAAGTTTYSTAISVIPNNSATGTVYLDSSNNNCASGATADPGIQMRLENSTGTLISQTTTNAQGGYTLPDTADCSNRHIIVNVFGSVIKRVDPGTGWQASGFTLNDYGPFSFPPDKTVNFCMSAVSPWFQTDSGDVRFPNLLDKVPENETAATGANPGILYSSNFQAQLGTDVTSRRVDNEYSYANNWGTARGAASYSFYLSQAQQKNVTVTELCSADCTKDGASVTNTFGIQRVKGNLTISSNGTLPATKHLILLVDGAVTINGSINVPGGAGAKRLFIVASKGDITVASGVTSLDGIYTSEGSILLPSAANCTANTPDVQLLVSGTLVANAFHPFATNGSGKLVNNRTLCAGDATTPSLKVQTRLDFITELTDFYKLSNKTFRETQP